jgi:formylglycine-generating enzyme required for sulfatase activity
MKITTLIMVIILWVSFGQEPKAYIQKLPGSELEIEMVAIPSGSFQMGSKNPEDKNAYPQRKVSVNGFWMSSKEVTWELYREFLKRELDGAAMKNETIEIDAVTGATIPYVDMGLGMGSEGSLPVANVTVLGASQFCKWLTALTGVHYRLPTEAEWEYAARAGSAGPYFFEDDGNLEEYAWFDENSGESYHEVGQKKPNPWGLYDMYGNVAEWTLDQYVEDAYTKDQVFHPITKPYPTVVRGGSFKDTAKEVGSTVRMGSDLVWKVRDPQFPQSKWWNTDAAFVGFRIVRPVETPEIKEDNTFWIAID